MGTRSGSHAVVVGAGMAGLLTARVLSDRFDQVTVLERDRLPQAPAVRRAVPQGRHANLLLAAGQRLLDNWFPALSADLGARGAVPLEARDGVWHQGGGYRARPDLGYLAMSASRPLLEGTVRDRLLERTNVRVIDDCPVDGPMLDGDRVVGVLADDVCHRADLVVGCGGRHSNLLELLADAGFPAPTGVEVPIDLAYASTTLPRETSHLEGSFAVVVGVPQTGRRVALLLPIEGGRWSLTVATFHGDDVPNDPDGLTAFAKALPSPVVSGVLERTEPLGPVLNHRIPTARRLRLDRLSRVPTGFVVLGDTMACLDPVFGQGTTCAAQQAQVLAAVLDRHPPDDPALPRAFYRRAAAVVDRSWSVSAAADLTDPLTAARRPVRSALTGRYLGRAARAAQHSPGVATTLTRVEHLLDPPSALLRPGPAVRVLAGPWPASVARSVRRSRT